MNSAPATIAIPGYLAGTWKADPVHSEIAFSVRHLMISKVRGRFTSYDIATVTSENPLTSSVTATIDLASTDTGNEQRDNHSAPPTTSRSRSTPRWATAPPQFAGPTTAGASIVS